jgi:hypothetical protein
MKKQKEQAPIDVGGEDKETAPLDVGGRENDAQEAAMSNLFGTPDDIDAQNEGADKGMCLFLKFDVFDPDLKSQSLGPSVFINKNCY